MNGANAAIPAWLAAALLLLCPAPGRAEPIFGESEPTSAADAGPTAMASGAMSPWLAWRSLTVLRDDLATGGAVRRFEAVLLHDLGEALRLAPADAWKDERNRDALLAFALAGGAGAILAVVTARAPNALDPERRAILDARSRGVAPDAAHVAALPIDLRALIALMGAETADDFRRAELLAPGTLIEEAALRRRLALGPGQVNEDETALGRYLTGAESYLRRFGTSPYAGPAVRRMVVDLAPVVGAAEMSRLVLALDPSRRDVFALALAREALVVNRPDLARAALDHVAAGDDRTKLAALVGGGGRASPAPKGAEPLARAVRTVAAAIRAGPVAPPPQPDPGGPDDEATVASSDKPLAAGSEEFTAERRLALPDLERAAALLELSR